MSRRKKRSVPVLVYADAATRGEVGDEDSFNLPTDTEQTKKEIADRFSRAVKIY